MWSIAFLLGLFGVVLGMALIVGGLFDSGVAVLATGGVVLLVCVLIDETEKGKR